MEQNTSGHKIHIEFGVPKHGWLRTRFTCGDLELEAEISDFPIDPMQQLCDALIQLHKGISVPQIVEWHLEPYCYYLQLERSGDFFIAKMFESGELESPMKLLGSFKGSYEHIVLPLYRAYKRFTTGGFKRPHWDEPDPERIAELAEFVSKRKRSHS